jgi:hypothetical protein
MPTKEQMAAAAEHIRDVIGRRYIEGDGDACSCWFQPEGGGPVGMTVFQGVPVGTPEPFSDLPARARIELLDVYVDWEGFNDAQEWSVIQRVLDGESPEFWMDGIVPDAALEISKELFDRGMTGESPQGCGQFFTESEVRALSRMRGKDGGYER